MKKGEPHDEGLPLCNWPLELLLADLQRSGDGDVTIIIRDCDDYGVDASAKISIARGEISYKRSPGRSLGIAAFVAKEERISIRSPHLSKHETAGRET